MAWESPGLVQVAQPFGLQRVADQVQEMKDRELFRKGVFGIEAVKAEPEVTAWLERRLDVAQADYRADISRRWDAFDQSDRRFKEWARRENEQLSSHLQQVRVASMDGLRQHQQQVATMTAQMQKLELRAQELESATTQLSARTDGLAHGLQVSAGSGGTGAAPNGNLGAMQAGMDMLRADLERESASRQTQGHDSHDRFKEVHTLLGQLASRLDADAAHKHQQLQNEDKLQQEKLSTLEPSMSALRSEVDMLREQLRRASADSTRRCEEVESSCAQRIAGVHDAALTAARELWEEHQGVVAECKASLGSLQQILETKDKIAAQLQAVHQQQREDDKQDFMGRVQPRVDALQNRFADVEKAVAGEQTERLEAIQQLNTYVERMAVALEKAQSSWVRDADRLSEELRSTRRQVDEALSSDARAMERRFAETADSLQKRLDELDSKASKSSSGVIALQSRLEDLARAREAEIYEAEARLKRQIADNQSMLVGKIGQCDFDLRALLRTSLAERAHAVANDLASVAETASKEKMDLMMKLDDFVREADERFGDVRQDFEARLQELDSSFQGKHDTTMETCGKLKLDIADCQRESRAFADRVAQESRKIAESADAALREELARQAQRHDHVCSGLSHQVSLLEEDLRTSLSTLESKSTTRLLEEMKLEREKNREDSKRLAEEERSARMQAETERLSSLNKRLTAHEELLAGRIEDLRTRLDDAHATSRQNLEAKLTQDRHDLQAQVDKLKREQSSSAAEAKEQFHRLGLNLDAYGTLLDETIGKFWDVATKDKAAFQDSVEKDLATMEERLIVSHAEAQSSLRERLDTLDSRVNTVAAEAREGRAAIRQDLESGIARLDSSRDAVEERLSNQHSSAVADLNAKIDNISRDTISRSEKLQAEMKALERVAGQRIDDLAVAYEDFRNAVQADTAEAADRIEQLAENVRGVEDGMLAKLADAEQLVKNSMDSWQLGQDALSGMLDDSKALITENQSLNADAREKMETMRAMSSGEVEAVREELIAAIEAAKQRADDTTALAEERMNVRIASQEDKSVSLVARLDEVADDLHKEEGQARAAEAALKTSLEDMRASLRSEFQNAASELSGRLDTQGVESMAKFEERDTRSRDVIDEMDKKLRELSAKLGDIDLSGEEQSTAVEDLTGKLELLRESMDALAVRHDVALKNEEERSLAAEAQLQGAMDAIASRQAEATRAADTRASGVEAQLKSQLEGLESKLDQSLKEEAERAVQVEVKLQKDVDAVTDLYKAAVQAEESRATAVERELQETLKALPEKQRDMVAGLEERCEAADAALKSQLEALKSVVEAQTLSAQAESRGQLDAVKAQAESQLENLGKQLKDEIARLEASLSDLGNTEFEARAAMQEASARAEDELRKQLEQLAATEAASREALKVSIQKETHERIESRVDSQSKELNDAIDQKIQALRQDADKAAANVKEQVEAAQKSSGVGDEVKAALERLTKELAEEQAKIKALESTSEEKAQIMDKVRQGDEELRKKEEDMRLKEAAEIAKRLEKLEEATALFKEVQERQATDQSRLNVEVAKRQDATISDLEMISQKIDELTAQGEAARKVDEQQNRSLAEMAELREQFSSISEKQQLLQMEKSEEQVAGAREQAQAMDEVRTEVAALKQLRGDVSIMQEKNNALQKEVQEANERQTKAAEKSEARTDGFEEQLGALLQSTADVMGKLDDCAKKKDLVVLRGRLEGAIDSMVVQLETERWVRQNVDAVADGINNSFLHLLDQSAEKVGERVRRCEAALIDGA
eukprot:TRINITY_DN29093_c0_g1_i1.p1 TRINITY_DN29093_c0_g1~~TRINITY_DN29093_c0_g1_i1.p1  ORF type:complete len:1935 (-),score=530.76 TRINITY_DN29093_c0_g1_i1:92-5425(-)